MEYRDLRGWIDAARGIAIGPDAETKRETRKKWGWILQHAVADTMREETAAPGRVDQFVAT